MNTGTAPNGTNMLFNGVYANPQDPLWAFDSMNSPANLEVSTLTVNSVPAGNILLTHNISSAVEYNAPLLFQRPAADINAPVAALVMNTSVGVPTKPVDGQYVTLLKANETVYDDLAVAGLQVYGDQTVGSPAAAYIYGLANGDLNIRTAGSVNISSLYVSSLFANSVVSTTANTATSYTATQFMSTPIIYSQTANISTINVSTLNAPSFVASTLSTISIDAKVTLTSTLSLTGSPTNINLGLGDVIQGLVGGAATQALGVGIGGAGLITGAVALTTGRTSGGVNSNVFQTVNGATQLQFSTIGSAVSSIFLTVNSPNPLTTPGLEIQQSQGVAAGTYCVRSVGDPLYITNNVSSIQMYGQWVPVIQPTATVPALAISSLGVSSINNAPYPPPGGGGGIPSTLNASTINVNGNLTQSGTGIFNWGGNTMSPTQVVLGRPTAVNATLTTTGGAFLNAGATVNSGLTVASGGATITGNNLNVGGNAFVTGVLQGGTIQAIGGLSVSGGISVNNGGIQIAAGNFNMTGGASVANITNLNVNQNLTVNQRVTANAISTTNISTNNINVFTINNQTYPPPSGGGIPSTLNASTINFNGGLTNNGTAPITTGTITTTNANVNFYNGNSINANTAVITNINTNNLGVTGITAVTAQIPSITNVSSINGVIYPPPGSSGIPSTLNASTINVNGGLVVNNGNVNISTSLGFNNSAFLGGGTDFRFRLGGVANRMQFVQNSGNNDAIIMDLNADKTTRLYSTLLVRDSTWPNVLPSFASIRTYDTNDLAPYGSVITGNVSTFGLHSHTASLTTLITSNLFVGSNANLASISTTNLNATNLNATNLGTANINVSSINNVAYPPPTLVPVGSITIWAGGSDNGSSQNFNIPAGWFLCDGSEKDKLVYANLYGVIGDKYAMNRTLTGTNFYLPDLTFAVPMGTPLRNYIGSNVLSAPSFQCSVQTWQSDFAPSTVSSVSQTWKISQTVGGTLNYGTFFPANAITQPGYPSVYVSNILSYDGNVGYVVVKSVNNTPIPTTLGTITARGSGTVPQDAAGTYLYTLGSYGAESGYPQVTHNQKGAEVGGHTHSYNRYGLFGSTGLANGNIDPSKSSAFQDTGSNQISSISTVGATNVGTYTAPNFINMLYIIRY